MQKDVIFSEKDGRLIAYIQCDVDHHTARSMREKIDAMIFDSRTKCLVLDFTRVEFMDSSGLGLILGRVERAQTLGAVVELTGLSPTLKKLLSISGIERIHGLSMKV